jgi:hypothetical protein
MGPQNMNPLIRGHFIRSYFFCLQRIELMDERNRPDKLQ